MMDYNIIQDIFFKQNLSKQKTLTIIQIKKKSLKVGMLTGF